MGTQKKIKGRTTKINHDYFWSVDFSLFFSQVPSFLNYVYVFTIRKKKPFKFKYVRPHLEPPIYCRDIEMSHLKGEGGASGARTRAGFEGEGQALDTVGTDQLSLRTTRKR